MQILIEKEADMKRIDTNSIYSHDMQKKCDTFAENYKEFLNNSKTEREAIDSIVNEITDKGYIELSEAVRTGKKLKEGDKIYSVWMNKSIAFFQIGKESMERGMNILGAHIDSPRMDVKQNPLYEDGGLAFLDTHYYGGIKKYLFVALPLALHGVVVRKDGTTVELSVGEDEDDPVFFISDLLVHLSAEQLTKKASEVIEGEALDLVVGSRPLIIDKKDKSDSKEENVDEKLSKGQQYALDAENEESELKAKAQGAVKRGILAILKDEYGIEEEDFISAELEVVPAGKARDAGFDRALVLGYGQDDRVCAYPSMRALLDTKKVSRTSCCILVDKEEIGSVGATGMSSHFFENAVAEVLGLMDGYSELSLRRCLANSCMLSSDVSAAFDPSYKSVFEEKNSCYLGKGMVFNKYTGSRGKYSSNDANAEFMAHIRSIFDKEKINFQTAELGKVDKGGGGTIAYILARYGMNVIDSGVAVLNMHAPWEATAKTDIYETYRGYKAFIENASLTND